MWTKLLIMCALVFVVTLAAETQTRPKNCGVGTTYKKDCNTCTCAADPKNDKCSQIDCSRGKPGPTQAPTGRKPRPGDCPTLVTPAPGSNICKNRETTSNCNLDEDCAAAKKCCIDGCGKKLCRNAIYRYNN